jgi:hypothetical protein
MSAQSQARAQGVKQQSQEVVEAYRVCSRFQELFAADLDFEPAFEATFTKDPKRRREIAIAEGDFGKADVTGVDDATLISAYKSRMQIAFLTLLVLDPDAKKFPPQLESIYDHGTPSSAAEVPEYAQQMKENAAKLRAYVMEQAAQDPKAAERVRALKSALAKPLTVPTNYVVKPLTAYSTGRVLDVKEEYYRIDAYSVIREGSQMRIIGIRFFTFF